MENVDLLNGEVPDDGYGLIASRPYAFSVKTDKLAQKGVMGHMIGQFDTMKELWKKYFPHTDIRIDYHRIDLHSDFEDELKKARTAIGGIIEEVLKGTEFSYYLLDTNCKYACGEAKRSSTNLVIMKHQGKEIITRTPGQMRYVRAIENNTITICKAVAGTGKTFLAAAEAVKMYKNGSIDKIVITRPAVPAFGEDLGALPGEINDKMGPYLRPITDALTKLVSAPKLEAWFSQGIVEICPLAYMRGRTFDNAFVIADEMQNSVPEQTEMLLSRLGENTKCIVEGDPYQQDKKFISNNGLDSCMRVLGNVPGVAVVEMGEEDCVRSAIASAVVRAYKKEHDRKMALAG